jgi:hypothetical protein
VPDIPVGRFRSSQSCSRWAAGWPCSCLRPGRAAGSARTIPSRLLLRRWPSARRCRWNGRRTQPRCGSGGIAPQGFQCPRSGTGSGAADQCTSRGLLIDLSCTRRIPAPVTRLDHQPAKAACAAASEVPGRLGQTQREESGDVHLQRPRYWPTPWTEAQVKVSWLPTGSPGRWSSDIPAVYLGCTRVPGGGSMVSRSAARPSRRPRPQIGPGHMM